MKTKIQKFIRLKNDFGLIFTLKCLYWRVTKQYKKYVRIIEEYLTLYLKPEINKYCKLTKIENDKMIDKIIWICWWQGEDAMPAFCKMCYQNLLKNTPKDYTVKLITKDNYQNYTSIPHFIIEKIEQEIIPITQFCDVLRQSLLLNNGGIWIDASIWVTNQFTNYIDLEREFWSIKLPAIDDPNVWGQIISECKWASFIFAGKKGCLAYKFVFETMCKYYSEHNSMIDYFLQNMLLRIAYNNIPLIKNMIDAVPISNTHLYDLYRYMDEPFDSKIWKDICQDTGIFKLTQKRPYKEFENGKITFYGKLKRGENK